MKIQLLLGVAVLALVLVSTEGRSFPRRGGRHHGHEAGRGGRRRIQQACTLAPESGVCFARKQMWFYNSTSETCQTFTYGGCGGNRNRFFTEEGCMRRCSDPCTRPLDQGDECTDDSEPDASICYYYDSEDNSCKEFEYTGCGGNTNRFRSLRYCERRCVDREEEDSESSDEDLFDSDTESDDDDEDLFGEDEDEEPSDSEERRKRRSHSRISRPRCQAAMCRLQCLYGQEVYTDGNGCIKCRCKQPRCPEVQRCAVVCEHGHVIDPTTGCETCACNDADSVDDDDTDVHRIPEHCTGRPMCLMYCHYGFQKGEDGCPICRCNRPPTDVEELPKHCLGRVMCAMHCEHGFQTGDDGCPICRCNAAPVALEVSAAGGGDGTEPEVRGIRIRPNRCPLVRCMLACRYGFQRGEDGCPTCSCNPAPLPTPIPDRCPRFRCLIACQYGFQTDERGCTTCRCNPPPTPLPELCRNKPMCRMACPNGFETDENGCPICRCKPSIPELPMPCRNRPMCRMACPNGFETDEDGCAICRCKPSVPEPPNCSPWMCMMWCEHGFQIGPDGCEICRCNRPPRMELEAAAAVGTDSLIQPFFTPQEEVEEEEEEEEIVRIIRRRRCPRFRCRRRCQYGFQKDENGCDKCVCNAAPRVEFPEQCSDRPACYRRCPNGFEVDDEGCPLCRCARAETRTTRSAPAPTCPPRIACLSVCDYGRVKDENGCDTCDCLPGPDRDLPELIPLKGCPSYRCLRHCEFGSVPDENGCDTCNCRPAPQKCPFLYCFIPCLHGSIPDENGCETCNCLPEPTRESEEIEESAEELPDTTPSTNPDCPVQLYCLIPCPGGRYKYDRYGCQTCECLNICRPIRCPMVHNCPFGRQRDENGCETCQCRNFNPAPAAPSGEETSAVRGVVHAVAGGSDDGYVRVRRGAGVVDGGDVCRQPLVVGPCFAAIPRFYYNDGTGKCEMFRYGGCRGNGNNFRTGEECRRRCETS